MKTFFLKSDTFSRAAGQGIKLFFITGLFALMLDRKSVV